MASIKLPERQNTRVRGGIPSLNTSGSDAVSSAFAEMGKAIGGAISGAGEIMEKQQDFNAKLEGQRASDKLSLLRADYTNATMNKTDSITHEVGDTKEHYQDHMMNKNGAWYDKIKGEIGNRAFKHFAQYDRANMIGSSLRDKGLLDKRRTGMVGQMADGKEDEAEATIEANDFQTTHKTDQQVGNDYIAQLNKMEEDFGEFLDDTQKNKLFKQKKSSIADSVLNKALSKNDLGTVAMSLNVLADPRSHPSTLKTVKNILKDEAKGKTFRIETKTIQLPNKGGSQTVSTILADDDDGFTYQFNLQTGHLELEDGNGGVEATKNLLGNYLDKQTRNKHYTALWKAVASNNQGHLASVNRAVGDYESLMDASDPENMVDANSPEAKMAYNNVIKTIENLQTRDPTIQRNLRAKIYAANIANNINAALPIMKESEGNLITSQKNIHGMIKDQAKELGISISDEAEFAHVARVVGTKVRAKWNADLAMRKNDFGKYLVQNNPAFKGFYNKYEAARIGGDSEGASAAFIEMEKLRDRAAQQMGIPQNMAPIIPKDFMSSYLGGMVDQIENNNEPLGSDYTQVFSELKDIRGDYKSSGNLAEFNKMANKVGAKSLTDARYSWLFKIDDDAAGARVFKSLNQSKAFSDSNGKTGFSMLEKEQQIELDGAMRDLDTNAAYIGAQILRSEGGGNVFGTKGFMDLVKTHAAMLYTTMPNKDAKAAVTQAMNDITGDLSSRDYHTNWLSSARIIMPRKHMEENGISEKDMASWVRTAASPEWMTENIDLPASIGSAKVRKFVMPILDALPAKMRENPAQVAVMADLLSYKIGFETADIAGSEKAIDMIFNDMSKRHGKTIYGGEGNNVAEQKKAFKRFMGRWLGGIPEPSPPRGMAMEIFQLTRLPLPGVKPFEISVEYDPKTKKVYPILMDKFGRKERMVGKDGSFPGVNRDNAKPVKDFGFYQGGKPGDHENPNEFGE